MRSAKAPSINAGVMMANMHWNMTKTSSGMSPVVIRYVARSQRMNVDATQKRFVKTTHKERQRVAFLGKARIERPTIAERNPQDADNAHNKQCLHDDAQYILSAHQSAIKKSDARNAHQQYQDGRNHYPSGVPAV